MAPPGSTIRHADVTLPLALSRLRAGRHWVPLVVVAGVFAASRAAAYAAGVRFDSSPLGLYGQIVDPELLKTRLAESLFYLHGQPPLFNLYLGVLLKAFGAHYASIAQATYILLGIVGAFALYGLLFRLGCSTWLSVALAVLIAVAPPTILYENWLFYEYSVAVLLVLSGFALAGFMSRPSFLSGSFFFLLLAAVIWMRSTFQIVWMLFAAGLVMLALRTRKQLVLRALLVPLLLVVALYGKNLALFDLPSTSSWFGMNWAKMIFTSVSPADRARLVERGALSRVSLVAPFSELEAYRGSVTLSRPSGIAVLDETHLPSGTPNLNNRSYVRISNLYLRDSLRLVREEPSAYARSVLKAVKLSFVPSADYDFVRRNRRKIGFYTRAFHRVVYLQTPYAAHVGIAILGAYALALLYGLRLLRLWIRSGMRSDPKLVTLLYGWFTVLYMTLILALTSGAENQRIRFAVDALVVVLVASALSESWPAVRRLFFAETGRFGGTRLAGRSPADVLRRSAR